MRTVTAHYMKEKRTVVVTLRLKEAIGEAAKRYANRDRRPLSSFLALVVEDAIKTMMEQEKPEKTKGRK
jgi:hypothetical protein